MATIREVARLARVSIGTVSNVLTGSVPVSSNLRDRVLAIVQKLDYQPNHVARSLKIRHTKMIGMVVSDITYPSFSQMIRGADEAARNDNYLLVVLNSDRKIEREQQVLTALRTRRVDGILLAPTGSTDAIIRAIKDSGVPIVCMGRDLAGVGLDCVLSGDFDGARKCVRHLLSLRHTRIAFLRATTDGPAQSERLRGYRQELVHGGLTFDPDLVLECPSTMEDGCRAAVLLLERKPRPDAVVAGDGMLACGVLRAAAKAGLRCPDDLAVVSFDDPFSGQFLYPPVTAAAPPAYEMGTAAMELLLKRIQEPARRKHKLTLEMPFSIRDSCGGGSTADFKAAD